LLFNTFSTDRNSPRYPSVRRLLVVLLFLPLFFFNLMINRVFMLLDNIIFFNYRKLDHIKAVFIIGVPRSATTYLFNLLYQDKANFHGFTLWELAFAPSICQKYLFLLIRHLDRNTGNHLYKLSVILDKAIFGKFVHIHDIGLTKPEEDEALFLYNLSSLYFFYFWPGVDVLEKLFYHDSKLPEHVKRQNIDFYYRCIQRHKYVFDRGNNKYFLSKNPTFIPRMESIAKKFHDARFIYPVRTPYKTIPSTICLNAHILSNFCTLPEAYPFAEQTRDFILNWYIMADKALTTTIRERHVKAEFEKITRDPKSLLADLYKFLELNIDERMALLGSFLHDNTRQKSRHEYPGNLGVDRTIIKDRLKGIIADDILDAVQKVNE
jgi:omega-hydroxy-beta-dihydromenaquinone-9 sulfotransferase